MTQKKPRLTDDADRVAKDIKRQTRRRYSAEEKIRIVLAGLRGESSIAELCRQESLAQSQYYAWSDSRGKGHHQLLGQGPARCAGPRAEKSANAAAAR